jgi:hypothetical protein
MTTDKATYLIVSVNEEGEHEIIFVTSDRAELTRRWLAFSGNGSIYTKVDLP